MNWCWKCQSRKWMQVQKGLKDLMESAAELLVPLVVDIGVGDNWDEAH